MNLNPSTSCRNLSSSLCACVPEKQERVSKERIKKSHLIEARIRHLKACSRPGEAAKVDFSIP